ncbi:hypothetical protein NXW99_18060 [Bacteroides faecis]|nr:hypothetical protein [Bacteroides faecis]MCS2936648.1 hypothetical protein [Bacteroides faecis]UVS47213.1 hypothetical protein NXW99_18060 [Bacteroides faecis]
MKTLRKCGYTGDVIIVLDNEDKTINKYREIYQNTYVFDKKEIASRIDEGDNFNDRRAIIYARNASFEIAKEKGYRYFIELDDDYTEFSYTYNQCGYLQPIITQYFIDNKSEIWLLFLIAHSKR